MEKAIFFDLDGTLWDALIPNLEAWNYAMNHLNEPYIFDLKTITSFMGLTPKETADLAFKETEPEKRLDLFKETLKISVSYMKDHPGTLYKDELSVLLELSKSYPLFIVSNCEAGYIENYLNFYRLNDLFLDHVCVGDTGLDKWKNILYLKKKYAIKDVIYVGDTNKDYIEASKAKVNFIHASYGFGKDVNCEFKITSLGELNNLVKKIFN